MRRLLLGSFLGVVALCAVGLAGLAIFRAATIQELAPVDLAELFPEDLEGWRSEGKLLGADEALHESTVEQLGFEDFYYREFVRGRERFAVYVGYWKPGQMPVRLVQSHTPDACWVRSGWERLDRVHGMPIGMLGRELKPVQYGAYEKDGVLMKALFWHLIGKNVYSHEAHGEPNPLGALMTLFDFALEPGKEQFFVRIQGEGDLQQLLQDPSLCPLLEGFEAIGLTQVENPEGGSGQ